MIKKRKESSFVAMQFPFQTLLPNFDWEFHAENMGKDQCQWGKIKTFSRMVYFKTGTWAYN